MFVFFCDMVCVILFTPWKYWPEIIPGTMAHLWAIFAGSLGAAYSLKWGAQKIWGMGGGETLALL